MPSRAFGHLRLWVVLALAAALVAGLWWATNDGDGEVIEPATSADPPAVDGLIEAEPANLVRVIDGDTVVVVMEDGREERVRLIGFDAPETHHEAECFGREATATLESLVSPGDDLRLWIDPTQDETDRFDRALRFITTDDGTDLGHEMLLRGVAEVYVYRDEFILYEDYRAAEGAARDADQGLWGACE